MKVDEEGKRGKRGTVEIEKLGPDAIDKLWLRNVRTDPAEFLRARFAAGSRAHRARKPRRRRDERPAHRGWRLLLAAIAPDAVAAGGPVVRTRLAPAAVVIGQPVTLAVDILVPTWFGGAIDYPPTIALPGAVAKLSDERRSISTSASATRATPA